jgi:hypothetical protein
MAPDPPNVVDTVATGWIHPVEVDYVFIRPCHLAFGLASPVGSPTEFALIVTAGNVKTLLCPARPADWEHDDPLFLLIEMWFHGGTVLQDILRDAYLAKKTLVIETQPDSEPRLLDWGEYENVFSQMGFYLPPGPSCRVMELEPLAIEEKPPEAVFPTSHRLKEDFSFLMSTSKESR